MGSHITQAWSLCCFPVSICVVPFHSELMCLALTQRISWKYSWWLSEILCLSWLSSLVGRAPHRKSFLTINQEWVTNIWLLECSCSLLPTLLCNAYLEMWVVVLNTYFTMPSQLLRIVTNKHLFAPLVFVSDQFQLSWELADLGSDTLLYLPTR